MHKRFAIVWCLVLAMGLVGQTAMAADVVWDFEDGNDHGFVMSCLKPATPAPDDPDRAGDESLTGAGGPEGLPAAGNAWSVGTPWQYVGLKPAVEEGRNIVDGVIDWGHSNPFRVEKGDPNPRGQYSYLNTYSLSCYGDRLHAASNDQIATSPRVVLGEGSVLTVWAYGGGKDTFAPLLDSDPDEGYMTGSSGVAVRALDGTLLASVHTDGHGDLREDTIDLSDFAGQTVFIEVVDCFEGAWGWIAVDEIRISSASVEE